mmetsp:Transcript_30480/g.59546  ORF Transcript_30480/g.59546 Transcript_30480/m.59546 type:complete len:209 (+) Transcript_30480:120-746(+)
MPISSNTSLLHPSSPDSPALRYPPTGARLSPLNPYFSCRYMRNFPSSSSTMQFTISGTSSHSQSSICLPPTFTVCLSMRKKLPLMISVTDTVWFDRHLRKLLGLAPRSSTSTLHSSLPGRPQSMSLVCSVARRHVAGRFLCIAASSLPFWFRPGTSRICTTKMVSAAPSTKNTMGCDRRCGRLSAIASADPSAASCWLSGWWRLSILM